MKKLIKVLRKWESRDRVYDLASIQNIEGFMAPVIGDCCYSMDVADDTTKTLNKQFRQFATDGQGGIYALWDYPELVTSPPFDLLSGKYMTEPPVVFFGADGHYSMIAPNLEGLIGLLTYGKFLFPEVASSKDKVWFGWQKWHPDLEEIVDEYGFEDSDSAKHALIKSMNKFKAKVQKRIMIKPYDMYIEQITLHKNFRKWYEETV